MLPVVLLLAVFASSAIGEEEFELVDTVNETPFVYFSEEAKKVAKELLTYGPEVDASLKEYVEVLKTSNSASKALKKYKEDVSSRKGSDCAVDKDDEDHFSGAQENIEAIVETCAAAYSQEDKEKLEKLINEELAKVQAADNVLLRNAELCTSLRVPPSPACVEEREQALGSIKRVLNHEGRARINKFFRDAFFNSKESIHACVEDGTTDLRSNLDNWIKRVESCNTSPEE